MIEKSFGQFIAETRGVPCTYRGENEIELDGALLSEDERVAILTEFEAWEPAFPA